MASSHTHTKLGDHLCMKCVVELHPLSWCLGTWETVRKLSHYSALPLRRCVSFCWTLVLVVHFPRRTAENPFVSSSTQLVSGIPEQVDPHQQKTTARWEWPLRLSWNKHRQRHGRSLRYPSLVHVSSNPAWSPSLPLFSSSLFLGREWQLAFLKASFLGCF